MGRGGPRRREGPSTHDYRCNYDIHPCKCKCADATRNPTHRLSKEKWIPHCVHYSIVTDTHVHARTRASVLLNNRYCCNSRCAHILSGERFKLSRLF